MKIIRPTAEENYLELAKTASQRGTCIRRRWGAVIVKNQAILSTGYVGAPRGFPNCVDIEKCVRQEQGIKPGERYELCRSVHAEMNAIINAARSGVSTLNSKIYLYGENVSDGLIVDNGKPCKLCRRMIVNAGIDEVIVKTSHGIDRYNVSDWIEEAKKDPFKEIEPGY